MDVEGAVLLHLDVALVDGGDERVGGGGGRLVDGEAIDGGAMGGGGRFEVIVGVSGEGGAHARGGGVGGPV